MSTPAIAHHAHHGAAPPTAGLSRWSRFLWEAPLLLSIVFTALVVAWAQENDKLERDALRQSVIQRKISHGVQSRQGAICRSRLLTVTTTLRH